NPALPVEAIDDTFRKITRLDGATLDARNRAFHRLLVDGVTVEYRADGAIRGAQAQLLDFDDPENNEWLAVNQFTVVENKHHRRPDVVIFVNGLPLGVIELKNAADEDHCLGRFPAVADLPGGDSVFTLLQRDTGNLRRRSSANRLARRGVGVVQALAHDYRR